MLTQIFFPAITENLKGGCIQERSRDIKGTIQGQGVYAARQAQTTAFYVIKSPENHSINSRLTKSSHFWLMRYNIIIIGYHIEIVLVAIKLLLSSMIIGRFCLKYSLE